MSEPTFTSRVRVSQSGSAGPHQDLSGSQSASGKRPGGGGIRTHEPALAGQRFSGLRRRRARARSPRGLSAS